MWVCSMSYNPLRRKDMDRIRIIRLFTVLCLLQGLIMPAAAQSDPKATMEAINYVIRNVRPSSAAEPLAEDLCQKFQQSR